MSQVYNPYLPLNEYIPDGEPHLFDGRVYVYGSHDKANGTKYCEGDYVCWSAPEKDLSDWRYEGVIYRRDQDPSNADLSKELWAPDVTKGVDGRYYLYYCLSFQMEIGVAVSESPAGPFVFYGHVKRADQSVLSEKFPFDPAVLTDLDGRVYLYYGFAPSKKMKMNETPGLESLCFEDRSYVVELEADMLTVKSEPKPLLLNDDGVIGTKMEGHGFFEASSIRRFGDKYYFVYSSNQGHELCYAISDRPDEGFEFGGTLVSNGDLGLNGNQSKVAPTGNNHGGIVFANGNYYIFWHRQTNGTEFSRQGCAQKLTMREDGGFNQVEITSCGLNGGALAASGSYPAAIACHITCPKLPEVICYGKTSLEGTTMVTENHNEVYVANVENGSIVGFKYFAFLGADMITVELRGAYDGTILIATDPKGDNVLGEADLHIQSADWGCELLPIDEVSGTNALYFIFEGTGSLDFKSFSFLTM